MIPWPATRVAQTISWGPPGSWNAAIDASRASSESLPDQVQCVGEAGQHRLMDLDVACEHDQRLARFEEVVDPGDRGGELAARGQALQRPELRQALGAQRRRDL